MTVFFSKELKIQRKKTVMTLIREFKKELARKRKDINKKLLKGRNLQEKKDPEKIQWILILMKKS